LIFSKNKFVLFFRIRKLSLSILGPDEDRALVNTINYPQLPAIVIEQPEPSSANDENEQRRRTSVHTSNNDIKL
jgi:hypothetical protein